MGIPGLFAWLIRKYNKILFTNSVNNIDALYIDANCLFHLVYNNMQINDDNFSTQFIDNIILYIDKLIKHINPSKYTYIAVDGLPPYAKICQQRKRRFKSVYDEHLKNKLKEQYNKEIIKWCNINITPGTLFMEKLHEELVKYSNKINILYSSYHEKGEGEHKIIEHIKNNNHKKILIYGLDADLIILSFSLLKYGLDIYLLRDDKNKYVYLDINELINKCNIELNNYSLINNKCKNYYLNDIIFISYFLGNDFLPRLPTLNLKKNGGDIILDIYIGCYNKYLTNLIQNDIINTNFLLEIFKKLGERELEYYQTNTYYNQKCNSSDQYEIELWKINNILDNEIEKKIIRNKIVDTKYNYYYYYFKSKEHQQETINEICGEYIKGLLWIYNYYTIGCKNWKWYYPYDHSPFASDLYNYVLNNMDEIKKYKTEVDTNIEINISVINQLMMIIPPKYKNIIPDIKLDIYNNLETIEQYPINFQLDTFENNQLWQCNPIISIFKPFDLDKINK